MKCNCKEYNGAWTTVKCCNHCGLPINTESWDMKPTNDRTEIVIGNYKITKYQPIPDTNHIDNIWIENEISEGMSVDIDELFRKKH